MSFPGVPFHDSGGFAHSHFHAPWAVRCISQRSCMAGVASQRDAAVAAGGSAGPPAASALSSSRSELTNGLPPVRFQRADIILFPPWEVLTWSRVRVPKYQGAARERECKLQGSRAGLTCCLHAGAGLQWTGRRRVGPAGYCLDTLPWAPVRGRLGTGHRAGCVCACVHGATGAST